MKQMRHKLMSVTMAWAVCACANTPQTRLPTGPYIEAVEDTSKVPTPEPLVVGVPYPQPVSGQAKPRPPSPEELEQARDDALTPKQVIERANEQARQAPLPDGFVNAKLTYDYMDGALYQIWGAPNHLTTLSFAPGETVYSFAAGDTLRWLVEKTYSGEGASRRLHLLIQPTRRNLHTTMVVTSSRGVYHFELKSFQHEFLAGVEFRHPRVQLVELEQERQRAQANETTRSHRDETRLAVGLEDVVDDYQFVLEDRERPPSWMPRRVFHDGKRTFIDFGRELGGGELPGLFLLGRDRSTRLVQYRVQGRYMIVGEVIEFAVLKLGGGENDPGVRVGIELKGGKGQ